MRLSEAGAAPARRDDSEGAITGRPGTAVPTLRGALTGSRRLLRDFSGRPMTSFHLVVGVSAALLVVGLMMVLASSSVAAFESSTHNPFSVFENQTVFAVIGVVGFVVAMRTSVRQIRRWSFPAVAVSTLLLSVVLVPGVGAQYNGARSWIDLGSVSLQPSEPAKLALLLWMAHVLTARRNTLRSPRALLIPVLPTFLMMCVLLMLEPALGTTITLSIVFFAVLFFGGAPWWVFAGVATSAAVAGAYLATSAGYRSARITAFLNPQAHPELTYQLMQGRQAIGRGGWFGVGLGQSTAKYGWLPNASSDFIFAVIGEELGVVGAALVLVLFAVLAYTGLRIARRNMVPFIKVTASAATLWLVGQAAVNVGYVVGLLPVTGIPLPMISTGGTSLVTTMFVLGLLANIALREPAAAATRLSAEPSRMAAFLGLRPAADRAAQRTVKRPTTNAKDGSSIRQLAAHRPTVVASAARSRRPATAAQGPTANTGGRPRVIRPTDRASGRIPPQSPPRSRRRQSLSDQQPPTSADFRVPPATRHSSRLRPR